MAQPNVPALSEPIQQATIVRRDRSHTYKVFVRSLGAWWPNQPFSFGADELEAVHVQESTGGRVHEVWADGTEKDWGRVVAWEPPSRLVLSWEVPPAEGTEVEIRFSSLGPTLTRVELEHRGWDKLPPERLSAIAEAVAGRGGDLDEGWSRILGHFAAAAES